MDILSAFLQQSITFFAILDPIGISAIALSILSPNITKTQINKVAYKATITIIIAFFVVFKSKLGVFWNSPHINTLIHQLFRHIPIALMMVLQSFI